jgi:NAD(P)-dependent dehydrogenase (short-subunit alcohol dehydrogenase family)
MLASVETAGRGWREASGRSAHSWSCHDRPPENDIAPVVLALLSPDFNYVTGQTITVDAGAAVLR